MRFARGFVHVCCAAAMCIAGCAKRDRDDDGGLARASAWTRVKSGGVFVGPSIIAPQDRPFEMFVGRDKVYQGIIGPLPGSRVVTISSREGRSIIPGYAVFDPASTMVGGITFPPSLQVNAGWALIVCPPRFPIVRSPRTRGGVRAESIWVPSDARAFVLISVSEGVERLVYLGSFDASNVALPTLKLDIESNPPFNIPGATALERGEYVETVFNGATGAWEAYSKKLLSDPACPADLTNLVSHAQQQAQLFSIPWPPAPVIGGP